MGASFEDRLWQEGVFTWSDACARDPRPGALNSDAARQALDTGIEMLANGVHQFFARPLGVAESWRAWPEFRDRAVYLDIETNGGNAWNSITMVGLWDGSSFRALTADNDLGEFPDIISHYSCIVTFFGAGFDIPMLKKRFPKVDFDQIHIDLCPTLKKVELRGGLKKIEKQVGIARPEEADGLTGLDAIRLWRQYMHGDDDALETLIAYNREDVVNLERLMTIGYDRLRAATLGKYLPTATE